MPRAISYSILLLVCQFLLSHAQTSQIVYVAPAAANIRSGPGMEYKSIATVKQGSALKVISEKQGWYEILAGDTLDGWIAVQSTSDKPPLQVESYSQKYLKADLETKLSLIRTLSQQPSGKGFNFLHDLITSHHKYDFGIQNDKVVFIELFKGWEEAGNTSAISYLVFIMEKDLGGEIGTSPEAMAEIRIQAKDALKVLLRKK